MAIIDVSSPEGKTRGRTLLLGSCVLLGLTLGITAPVSPLLLMDIVGGDKGRSAQVSGAFDFVSNVLNIFLGSTLFGALSDTFGRRPVFVTLLLGYCLSSGLMILAAIWRDIFTLFLARVLSSVTLNFFVVMLASAADLTSHDNRSTSFGALGASLGVGYIVGPFIGGWLGHQSLVQPFVLAFGLYAVNFLFCLVFIPESLPKESRSAFAWLKLSPVGALRFLFKDPIVRQLTTIYVLYGIADSDIQSTFVFYGTLRFGWTAQMLGYIYSYVGVLAAVNQGVTVRVAMRALGERRAVVTGLSLLAAAHLVYGISWRGWAMLAALSIGSCGAVASPALAGILSKQVGTAEQGLLQGSLSLVSSLSGLVGPPVMTNVFYFWTSPLAPFPLPGAAFFLGSACFAAAVSYAALVFRRLPPEPKDAEAGEAAAEAAAGERAPLLGRAAGPAGGKVTPAMSETASEAVEEIVTAEAVALARGHVDAVNAVL